MYSGRRQTTLQRHLERLFPARRMVLSPGRGEDGLTLIELLIVVVLIPIIIGGVTIALITVFKDQIGVQGRLSDSHDAQITNAYFARDVQGATTISTNSNPICGPTGSGHVQVLGLNLPSASVAYVYDTVTYAHATLVREYCSPAVSTSLVAHGLTTQPTIHITCQSSVSPCAANGSGIWPSGGVATITITVPDTTSGFSYSVLSAPRQVATATNPCAAQAGGCGGQPPQSFSLILLGSGGSCPLSQPLLTIKNKGGLKLQSGLSIDSMAVNSSCAGSITQGNNSSFNANAVYTQVSPPSGTNANTGCQGCTGPSGYLYSANPVPDPYGGLTAPKISPVPPSNLGACIGTNNISCSAGLYSAANCPNFSNSGVTITFASGVSEFNGCTLSLPNNVTFVANNVLLYFTGSSSMLVGNSPSITITAQNTGNGCPAAPSTYPCVALWQDKSDTNSWSWGGGSQQKGTIAITGALYLPMTGLAVHAVQALSISNVVAQYLTIDNVGTTTIG